MLPTEARQPALHTRLMAGVGWNLIATVFNQGSTFAIAIIAARILGRQGFGEYAMVVSTLVTASGFAQLATGYTASKYVAEFRIRDKARTGRVLALCRTISLVTAVLGASALIGGAPWLAAHALNAPHLALPLALGSGYLLFSTINGYQMGALAGLEDYRGLAAAGVMSGVATLLAVSFGAWKFGLVGAIAALGAAALVRCLAHAWWLRRGLRNESLALGGQGMWQEARVLWRFALPAAISGFFSMPAIWFANSILVHQKEGYAAMAVYSAATSIRLLVLFVPNVINTVSLSILNNEKGNGDPRRYGTVFRFNVLVIVAVAFSAATFVGVFGGRVLQLFGRDFGSGKAVLWLLLASTLPESASIAVFQYIQSNEKVWLSFFAIVVPRETLLVVLAYLLTPQHGALGMGLAYLGAATYGLLSHVAVAAWTRGRLRAWATSNALG